MSDFTSAYAAINLDPYKRVHYAPGLVLGVEDFVQEELYLLGRDRLHNRALHGYGTLCGLAVESRAGDAGEPEILVRAGIALDPLGREIRVPQDQCAGINAWLEANAASMAGSPLPDPLPLYLVLCYRECTTDDVPVPGGPCRSLEDSRVPSRIADDFLLELRTEAPAQVEEDVVRAFGDLLRDIQVSDAPGDFLTGEELNDLVRALAGGSPGGVSGLGSPALLRVHPADAPDLFQDAFRVWVTEVRPSLLAEGRNCANGPPPDTCVLLARIDLRLEETDGVPRLLGNDPANAVPDEARRPYLLHTRLLQEWLRNRSDTSLGAAGGDLSGTYPDPTVVGLQGNPVAPAPSPLIEGALLTWGGTAWEAEVLAFGGDLAGDAPNPTVVALQGDPVAPAPSPLAPGQVLTWNGVAWQAADLPALTADHGSLGGLGDVEDHPNYLVLDGSRPMTGNLRLAGHDIDMGGSGGNPARIRNLSAGIATGQAVVFQQAVKVGDAAGGDLAGSYPNPSLRPGTLPGQVLTWNGAQWVPQPAAPAGVPEMESELVRIQALSWTHGRGNGAGTVLLDGKPVLALVVQFGAKDPGDASVEVQSGSLDEQTFQVFVRVPLSFLRPAVPSDGLYQWIGIEACGRTIFPVEGVVGPGGTDVRMVAGPAAPAAAFVLDERARAFLGRLLEAHEAIELRVHIHGDQVLDEKGRAIDASHLRAARPSPDGLPSGDRAGGSDLGLGLQGGLFDSWLSLDELADQGVPCQDLLKRFTDLGGNPD